MCGDITGADYLRQSEFTLAVSSETLLPLDGEPTKGNKMDDDNLLIKCVTLILCVLIVVAGGCVSNKHLAISRDLKNGVDPLAVACAHDNDNSSTACAILAAKK